MRHLALAAALAAAAALGACAGGAPADGGTITVTLPYSGGGWFRLRVLSGPAVGASPGAVLFDTGCVEARSRTFQISDLEAGLDRAILFEAFSGADCREAARIAMGYRGGVTVPVSGDVPYYHVPVFDEEAVTALPEDLNVSASTAVQTDFCDEDADCADVVSPGGGCYKLLADDGSAFNYWCVPTCQADADCSVLHPKATCDGDTGWCMLRSPFPLNLSEARALGHAATLSGGDVLFVGGFASQVGGRFVAGDTYAERFDAATGLFQRVELAGLDAPAVGLAGVADLGEDRLAVVGGARAAEVRWTRVGPRLRLTVRGLEDEVCSGTSCEPNVQASITVLDVRRNKAVTTELPVPLAMPTAVAVGGGRVLVLGGLVPSTEPAGGAPRTAGTWLCTIGDDLAATCEAKDKMTTGRAGAAAACLDANCRQVLVLGGNSAGAVAELVNLSTDDPSFAALDADDLPASVFLPALCGTRLVGGGAGLDLLGDLAPADLSVDGETLSVEPLAADPEVELTVLPAVVPDGESCWVVGGAESGGTTGGLVRRVTATAVAGLTYDLVRARFGAAAARIGSGPLQGALLIGGGAELLEGVAEGGARLVRGAEVLLP